MRGRNRMLTQSHTQTHTHTHSDPLEHIHTFALPCALHGTALHGHSPHVRLAVFSTATAAAAQRSHTSSDTTTTCAPDAQTTPAPPSTPTHPTTPTHPLDHTKTKKAH